MKRRFIIVAMMAVVLVNATISAYAFEVPLYRFDGAMNDELYSPPGVATAETGVQVIMPEDRQEAVLPYGVSLIGSSYSSAAAGTDSITGADGYPDVWGNSAHYNAGALSSTPDTTLSSLTQKDGSLGTLSIPTIKLSAKLYEDDMSNGVGHIPGTALWNGNVCIMGHNRGINEYFAKLYKLRLGDKITLTTNQGSRTYVVTYSGTVSATDWTKLAPTADNRLTLISCVADAPELRQCVQAVEIK